MPRLLSLLLCALLALPLASCDTVTGKGDNDGGGDVIITPPAPPTPQLHVAIGVTSQTTYSTGYGGGVSVTVVVSNEGPGVAKDVGVNVAWPSSIMQSFYAPQGASCSGSDFCESGETLQWNVGTIAEGGSRALTFSLAYARYGSYSGGVTATANASGAKSGSAAITLNQNGNTGGGEVTVSASKSAAAPGTELDLTASYILNQPLPSARLVMEVPSGMEVVSASGGGTLSGNAVVWSLGAVPDGAHGQRTARMRVSAGRKSGQTLVVTGQLQAGATLVSRSQATVEVPKAGGLEVSIAPSPWSISFTGSTSVTVRVVNTASTPAAGVLLVMPVPSYVQYFYAPLGTQCSASSLCEQGEQLEWVVGALEAGGSRTLTVSLSPGYTGGNYTMPLSASADATSGTGGAATAAVVVTD